MPKASKDIKKISFSELSQMFPVIPSDLKNPDEGVLYSVYPQSDGSGVIYETRKRGACTTDGDKVWRYHAGSDRFKDKKKEVYGANEGSSKTYKTVLGRIIEGKFSIGDKEMYFSTAGSGEYALKLLEAELTVHNEYHKPEDRIRYDIVKLGPSHWKVRGTIRCFGKTLTSWVKIENSRKQSAEWTVVRRAAREGDRVKIDFNVKGAVKGEAFDGGSAEDYTVVLGGKSMVPGFEEGLVGLKPEEQKMLKIKMPKDYPAKNVADRQVEFEVMVKQIEEAQLGVMNSGNDKFIRDVFFLLITIFKALDGFHKKMNKAHGDAHPGNILVADDGTVKLIDFGFSFEFGTVEYKYKKQSCEYFDKWRFDEGVGLKPASDIYTIVFYLKKYYKNHLPEEVLSFLEDLFKKIKVGTRCSEMISACMAVLLSGDGCVLSDEKVALAERLFARDSFDQAALERIAKFSDEKAVLAERLLAMDSFDQAVLERIAEFSDEKVALANKLIDRSYLDLDTRAVLEPIAELSDEKVALANKLIDRSYLDLKTYWDTFLGLKDDYFKALIALFCYQDRIDERDREHQKVSTWFVIGAVAGLFSPPVKTEKRQAFKDVVLWFLGVGLTDEARANVHAMSTAGAFSEAMGLVLPLFPPVGGSGALCERQTELYVSQSYH